MPVYLSPEAVRQGSSLYAMTFSFANVHYVRRVGWYVFAGARGLATRYVSLHDVLAARRVEST